MTRQEIFYAVLHWFVFFIMLTVLLTACNMFFASFSDRADVTYAPVRHADVHATEDAPLTQHYILFN